jgi:hypothetical protein
MTAAMNEERMKTPSRQRMVNAPVVNSAHIVFHRLVFRALLAISGSFQGFQNPVKYNRDSRINHRKQPGTTPLFTNIHSISKRYHFRKTY